MATSSASIEERSITPQAAATFLRPQAGKTSNGIAERSAPGDDVTWTPQPLGFRAWPFAKYIFDWAVPLRVD
jgi:hypothetical protein